QRELRLTYLFIAHDLSVVRHVSDRIAVMYLGRIVENASTDDLHADPLHPYTIALLSAIPRPDPEVEAHRTHIVLQGQPPSPAVPSAGSTSTAAVAVLATRSARRTDRVPRTGTTLRRVPERRANPASSAMCETKVVASDAAAFPSAPQCGR